MQGYSTLGSQWLMKGYHSNPVLTHPAVIRAAHGIHRSPAQVVLRWALQHGQVGSSQYRSMYYLKIIVIEFHFDDKTFQACKDIGARFA